jgi:hypothetical protein
LIKGRKDLDPTLRNTVPEIDKNSMMAAFEESLKSDDQFKYQEAIGKLTESQMALATAEKKAMTPTDALNYNLTQLDGTIQQLNTNLLNLLFGTLAGSIAAYIPLIMQLLSVLIPSKWTGSIFKGMGDLFKKFTCPKTPDADGDIAKGKGKGKWTGSIFKGMRDLFKKFTCPKTPDADGDIAKGKGKGPVPTKGVPTSKDPYPTKKEQIPKAEKKYTKKEYTKKTKGEMLELDADKKKMPKGSSLGKGAAKAAEEAAEKGASKGIFKGIGKGIGSVFKKLPIIGALYNAYSIIKSILTGDFIGVLTGVASGFIQLLDLVLPGLGTVLSIAFEFFGRGLIETVWGFLKFIGSSVWNSLKSFGSYLYEGMVGLFTSVGTFLSGIWESTKKTVYEWGNYLYEGMVGFFVSIGTTLNGMWESAKNAVYETVNYLYEGVVGFFSGIFNFFSNMASSAWEFIFGKDTTKIEKSNKSLESSATIKSYNGTIDANNREVGTVNNLTKGETIKTKYSSNDIQKTMDEIKRSRAETEPTKSEIVSSELDDISEESKSQTKLLEQLVMSMQSLIKEVKGEKPSGGAAAGDTSLNRVVHKPPNFHRNTIGLVSQDPSKGFTNFGPPKS